MDNDGLLLTISIIRHFLALAVMVMLSNADFVRFVQEVRRDKLYKLHNANGQILRFGKLYI